MNRIVVITGGAGGIGEATARHLISEGAKVVLLDHGLDRTKATAARLGCHADQLDVTDQGAIHEVAAKIEMDIGPVTGLVCGAAVFENPHAPEDTDPMLWQKVMDTNLSGTFWTATAFGKRMAARRYGAIVTLGSMVGMASSPLFAYGTSKAGIASVSASLAVAWGRSGVRVNCVSPGPTLTPALLASYERGERDPVARLRYTALGRMADPEDVANAIGFLLSDKAAAITGIELPVDCGIMAAQVWSLYNGVPEPEQDQP